MYITATLQHATTHIKYIARNCVGLIEKLHHATVQNNQMKQMIKNEG